jgi:AraC-like DNA-binding protein
MKRPYSGERSIGLLMGFFVPPSKERIVAVVEIEPMVQSLAERFDLIRGTVGDDASLPGERSSFRVAADFLRFYADCGAEIELFNACFAGMAVSTLHHHFRALTAMSPLQYQKQIRLQAARARMLADDVDAATVAFEVGYESASQFNREYSRLFGQPPIRDIRMLRSPGASRLEPVVSA